MLDSEGKIILKKEILKHLKVKPGEELVYKLLPGNRLILESRNNRQKNSSKEIKTGSRFELADYRDKEINIYNHTAKADNTFLLH